MHDFCYSAKDHVLHHSPPYLFSFFYRETRNKSVRKLFARTKLTISFAPSVHLAGSPPYMSYLFVGSNRAVEGTGQWHDCIYCCSCRSTRGRNWLTESHRYEKGIEAIRISNAPLKSNQHFNTSTKCADEIYDDHHSATNQRNNDAQLKGNWYRISHVVALYLRNTNTVNICAEETHCARGIKSS